MYTSYWQLSKRPFESGIDPAAYYPSETHQSSLLKLRYALEHGNSMGVLCGDSGMGKTLLVKLLAERGGETYAPWVHVVFPQMSTAELLAFVAADLNADGNANALAETISGDRPTQGIDVSIRQIGERLKRIATSGGRAVLVIDEAHLLEGQRTFETLRLLLNFEHGGQSDLMLLLVGRASLLPMLERLPQLDERVGVKCLLRPLNVEETMSYVQHRLQQAGARKPIFTTAALETVHGIARGMPRRINRLCDLALLVGFAEEQKQIGDRHIETVAQELVEMTAGE